MQFWGGLARRLLPAALLVLFTVAVASVFWLPRTLWDETIRQTFTSIFYVQNWQLAFDAVDYLQQGQAASPLQHYWALSAQGQFYLLWPIVLAASVALAARVGAKQRTIMLGAFAAIFVASFALSVVETQRNQAFTYFNTFARLWEFCLGAVLAVLPNVNLRREVRGCRFRLDRTRRDHQLRSDLSGSQAFSRDTRRHGPSAAPC